jgi:hypothetical protein
MIRARVVTTEHRERRERLDRAVRRNRGRLLLSAYLRRLGDRLGRPVSPSELVDLAETDAAASARENALEALETLPPGGDWTCLAIDTAERAIAREFLDRAGHLLNEHRSLWLMVSDSEYCGAVIVRVHELVERAFELTGEDEDVVRAGDREGSHGFHFYADTVSGHAPLRWTLIAWSRGDHG